MILSSSHLSSLASLQVDATQTGAEMVTGRSQRGIVLTALPLILLTAQACWALTNNLVDDELLFATPSITTAQLLETRGYVAEVHHFVSADNYVLEITRGLNPLINGGRAGRNGKAPLLLLHGTMSTAKEFLLNSAYVEPRVYDERIDPSTMSAEQLYQVVKDDPARRTLPFLAMNFGYEVWLLERRGFVPGSRIIVSRKPRTVDDAVQEAVKNPSLIGFADMWQQLQEPPTLNNDSSIIEALMVRDKLPYALSQLGDPIQDFVDTYDQEFWSFSMDEQAQRDLPAAIDYVLDKTCARKVHLLGYSAGGAISLMALSSQPELGDKISRLLLWAPSVNMQTNTNLNFSNLNYIGPTPHIYESKLIRMLEQQRCSTDLAQRTTCSEAIQSVNGPSGGQEPARLFLFANTPAATPTLEYKQLGQFFSTEKPCMFSFASKEENRAKYGQDQPPCYDLRQVAVRNISIYAGSTDTLITPKTIERTLNQLDKPIELHYIGNGDSVKFSHEGFLIHVQNDLLAIIPSLIDLERSDASERNSQAELQPNNNGWFW